MKSKAARIISVGLSLCVFAVSLFSLRTDVFAGDTVTLVLDANGGKFSGDETVLTVERKPGDDLKNVLKQVRVQITENYYQTSDYDISKKNDAGSYDTFFGWSTDGSKENKVLTVPESDSTLYAIWLDSILQNLNLKKFVYGKGSVMGLQVVVGEKIKDTLSRMGLPGDYAKEYVEKFKRDFLDPYYWATDPEGKNRIDDIYEYTPVQGVDLYAVERKIPLKYTSVKLSDKTVPYTGKPISIGEAVVTGETVGVYYTYYIDAACKIKTTKAVNGAESDGKAPKNIGTYYVVAHALGNTIYAGSKSNVAKLVITKVENPLKIKVSKKTYKRSKLKKAKKFKIGVSKAQGKLSYKLDKKAKKAKIKVSKKGVVTVPKKCKRGTYKITVKAAGNSIFKAGSKTVIIKVK